MYIRYLNAKPKESPIMFNVISIIIYTVYISICFKSFCHLSIFCSVCKIRAAIVVAFFAHLTFL